MLFFKITLSMPFQLLCMRSLTKLVGSYFKNPVLGTYRYVRTLALFLLDGI